MAYSSSIDSIASAMRSPSTVIAAGRDRKHPTKNHLVQQGGHFGDMGLAYTSRPSAPRFGNALVNTFQLITENFTAAFLAQDVLGMWVPRSGNALIRGREIYDPQSDPDALKRPFVSQFFHASKETLKGLNYPNFKEEVGREVETGPGVLVAATAVFGLATSLLSGQTGLTMGRHELAAFTQTYSDLVQKMGSSHPHLFQTPDTTRVTHDMTEHFIERLLKPHFSAGRTAQPLAHLADESGKAALLRGLTPADRGLYEFLYEHVLPAGAPAKATTVTYEEALKQWGRRWIDLHHTNTDVSLTKFFTWKNLSNPLAYYRKRRAYLNQIGQFDNALNQLISRYNLSGPMVANFTTTHVGEAGKAVSVNFAQTPHRVSHLLIEGEHGLIPTTEFVRHMERFKDVITSSTRTAAKTVGTEWGRLPEFMVRSVNALERSIVKQKAVLSVLATILAGAVVVTVSGLSQQSKAYPANRKLQLDGVNAKMRFTPGEYQK